jgi:hypothetical protein
MKRFSTLQIYAIAAGIFGAFYAVDTVIDIARDNRVAEARAIAQIAVVRADSILVAKQESDEAVRSLEQQAQERIRRASRAEIAANRAQTEYTRLRAQLASMPDAPIDSIRPVVDSTLAAADSTIAELRTSFEEQVAATALLQQALDSEKRQHAITAKTLGDLRTSTEALVKATKPSLLSSLLPNVGVGVAAGLDVTGRPNAVVGVTLSFGR